MFYTLIKAIIGFVVLSTVCPCLMVKLFFKGVYIYHLEFITDSKTVSYTRVEGERESTVL